MRCRADCSFLGQFLGSLHESTGLVMAHCELDMGTLVIEYRYLHPTGIAAWCVGVSKLQSTWRRVWQFPWQTHWGSIGIMENSMETTIVYSGYIGMMENKWKLLHSCLKDASITVKPRQQQHKLIERTGFGGMPCSCHARVVFEALLAGSEGCPGEIGDQRRSFTQYSCSHNMASMTSTEKSTPLHSAISLGNLQNVLINARASVTSINNLRPFITKNDCP